MKWWMVTLAMTSEDGICDLSKTKWIRRVIGNGCWRNETVNWFQGTVSDLLWGRGSSRIRKFGIWKDIRKFGHKRWDVKFASRVCSVEWGVVNFDKLLFECTSIIAIYSYNRVLFQLSSPSLALAISAAGSCYWQQLELWGCTGGGETPLLKFQAWNAR